MKQQSLKDDAMPLFVLIAVIVMGLVIALFIKYLSAYEAPECRTFDEVGRCVPEPGPSPNIMRR